MRETLRMAAGGKEAEKKKKKINANWTDGSDTFLNAG